MTIAVIHSLEKTDRLLDLMKLNMTVHDGLSEAFFRQLVQHNPASNNPDYHKFILLDDQLVAGTSLFRHKINWHGTEITVAEIGLVGTLEKYRNKGFSTDLMNHCMDEARTDGIPISFLWGIPNFYEKFHYYYGYPNHSSAYCVFPKSGIQKWENTTEIRSANIDDLPAIKKIYRQYNKNVNGVQVRSDEQWDYYFRLTTQKDNHGWWVTGNPIYAYAFSKNDNMEINEIGIADLHNPDRIEHLDSPPHTPPGSGPELNLANLIIGLFQRDPDNISELKIFQHPKMPIARFFYHHGASVTSPGDIYPGTWGGMVRINDLFKLMKPMEPTLTNRLHNSAHINLSTVIPITSEIGNVLLKIDNGNVMVENSDGGGIYIPPSVLTPIITGYRAFARYRHLLPDIPADILETLFPHSIMYMHDMLYIDEHFELSC